MYYFVLLPHFRLVYFHSPAHLIRYTIVTTVMSPNKEVIETYLASWTTDRPTALSCLTEDVERVEWADGFPDSGVPQRGKAAINQNLGDPETTKKIRTEISRMTEENNVVVAEGTVRVPKKEGGFIALKFCNVFELENGKVKRWATFTAEVKNSA